VVYVPGNHDYGIRKYTQWSFGEINIQRQEVHTCKDGKRLLITHGDEFDAIILSNNWTTRFGNHAYDILLRANCWFNELRERFGLGYWSLSSYIKSHIKQAQDYIQRYEDTVIGAAGTQNVDGVICGHIHHPNIRQEGDLLYINTGDWVEHCTAVCEDLSGKIQLIEWPSNAETLLRQQQSHSAQGALPEAA
jgi:UDP-2,3-diacylglucosamine pyrophosphatase LpxH